MKALLRLFSFALFLRVVLAIGQNTSIAFRSSSNTYKLASRSSYAQILVDAGEWPAVLRVAGDLAMDFGRVTGVNGSVTLLNAGNATVHNASMIFNVTNKPNWNIPGSRGNKGGTIIVGTIGNSSVIDSLVKAGKINVKDIEGKWESFTSAVVKSPVAGVAEALVIAGVYTHISYTW